MAELTPNLQLVKPTINGEDTENTWGYDLNSNFDILDDAVVQSRVSDGDKGDIIVSAQGELWNFDPTVVTPAGRGVIAVDAKAGLLEQNGATAFKKRGITVHNQPPSGGVDGDLWLQYNLALPPEVNWDVSSAYFNTRTEAMASDIPGPVKVIQTGGYSNSGDAGQGTHKRVNALPTHQGWFRSVDRYKADGGIDATNGGYWELVPEGGEVRIEQFGGKADYSGTVVAAGTGTDNYLPLKNALEFTAWSLHIRMLYAYKIKFTVGKYYISTMVEFRQQAYLQGVGGGQDSAGSGQGTQLFFPNTTTCFLFSTSNTDGEYGTGGPFAYSGGTVLDGLTICHIVEGSDRSKHGVHARTTPIIKNCSFYHISGHGIYIHGSVGGGAADIGNANCWQVRDCYVHSCGGDGLHIEGSDVNGGSCFGFVTHECGGCGVYEGSYVGGNSYAGLQITGYGNRTGGKGVSHAGNQYQLLSNGATAHTIIPGTDNATWYFIRAGGVTPDFPAFSGAAAYRYSLPILSGGSPCTFIATYVEGGNVVSHTPGGAQLIGGNIGATNTSNVLTSGAPGTVGMQNPLGLGARVVFPPGSPQNVVQGDQTYVVLGGDPDNYLGTSGGQKFITHRRAIDGDSSHQWGYYGKDIEYTAQGGVRRYWRTTTPSTTEDFGRGVPQPRYMNFLAFALGGEETYHAARIIAYSDAAPTSGAHARGEIVFNLNPTAGGFAGWSCVTSGTPGVWKTFGSITA